ncbi:MAG: mycofactocin-associated electron transfer flavoprotein beta subunit [Streptosporangiales bacterium]
MASTPVKEPLVVVCLRHVDQRARVDPLTGEIDRDPRSATASAADLAALEHALRIAEAWSGRVLAIAAGSPEADHTLRQAMALGAQVMRVAWPQEREAYVRELCAGERPLARALAGAIAEAGSPAVVLCGDRSPDRGTGSVPAFLAYELGAAQALGLVRLDVDGDSLRGERRLDAGRRERLRIPRPAVCSVEPAGVRLRRASLPATLASNAVPVPVVQPRTPPDEPSVRVGAPHPYRPRTRVQPPPYGDTPHERLVQLTGVLVAHDPPTVVGPTDAAHAAEALLDYLDRGGYARTPADVEREEA